MRKTVDQFLGITCLLILFTPQVLGAALPKLSSQSESHPEVQKQLLQHDCFSQVYFQNNKGQHTLPEKFIAVTPRYQVGFGTDYFTILYRDTSQKYRRTKVIIQDAEFTSSPRLENRLQTQFNYFRGKDSADWYLNQHAYRELIYPGIYPGIDLRFYDNEGELEFDFIISPSADPGQISLRLDETTASLTANGELNLDSLLTFRKPHIYQEINGEKKIVEGDYQIEEDIIRFGLNEYDVDQELTIDPTISYSTYFGGEEAYESLADIAVDTSGYVYLLGSSNFSFQWFIAKLLPGKSEFEFVNFYGSNDDFDTSIPRHLVVDNENNIIADLTTRDPNLPVKNALRSNFNLSPYIIDVYLIKITPEAEIVFATYLGGSKVDPDDNPLDLNGRDYTSGMVVDGNNNIWIAGETDGLNFPTTGNAHQSSNIGSWDLFLSKFSPTGTLLYSSLLGGFENDRINTGGSVKDGIAIDQNGRIYILGYTENQLSDFPATSNSFDDQNAGRKYLMSVFDTKTNTFIYTTFLFEFEPKFISVDPDQRIHMAGSGEWPDLVNPMAIEGNQFIMTMSPLTQQVHFSSFLPCNRCKIENFTVSTNKHLFFSAQTPDQNVTTTEGQIEFPLGKRDVYLGEIDIAKSDFVFATLLGGSENDNAGGGLEITKENKLYVGGNTNSTNYFTSFEAITPNAPGNGDIFLTIFDLGDVAEITVLDANPDFIQPESDLEMIDDIRQIEDIEKVIEYLPFDRRGVTADGASSVVLQILSDVFVEDASWTMDEKYGSIETPWGSGTHTVNSFDYFIALYTPPVGLPKDEDVEIISEIRSAKARFKIEFTLNNQTDELDFAIDLFQPPVVLVHGTFDNPDNCWKTPISPAANTMVQALEFRGFYVSTVDYSNTNGAKDTNLPYTEPSSSFLSNRKVVYSNPGGIEADVNHFREEFNLACTRADVVGHSMGGVLPRVLASDDTGNNPYNDDYYRTNNFINGDINRLISIASTHHGSDLSFFLHFFNTSWKNSNLPFISRLGNSLIPFALWLAGDFSESGAVRDQVPGSPGLQRIGPTEVPSHAIVCTVEDIGDFESNAGEPETFATYANILNAATAFFYFYHSGLQGFVVNTLQNYKRLPASLRNGNRQDSPFPPLPVQETLDASKPSNQEFLLTQIEEGFTEFWQNWHLLLDGEDDQWIMEDADEFILQYETAEYNMFEEDDDFLDHIGSNLNLISDEFLNNDLISRDAKLSAIDYLRYLIFKNDLNDGVVRYESQTGSLDQKYITHFKNHIHSYAPRYPEIINRIIQLLSGNLDEFSKEGFPAAGKMMPVTVPDPSSLLGLVPGRDASKHRTGCEAACWSGMVPSHAYAFAEVAADNNVVVLARPVNPDATTLILQNAATKGMNLKGKSSNWGPQKGYIPVNQKYSKLWDLYGDNTTERDKQIGKFSEKTTKQLENSPDQVVKRLLTISYSGCQEPNYKVFYDKQVSDAKQSIYLVAEEDSGYSVSKWQENGNPDCPKEAAQSMTDVSHLDSMHVMANPDPNLANEDGNPRFYTADYDLLAIGFYDRALENYQDDPYYVETLTNFDPEKGFITPKQLELLDDLNEAVKETGYEGGNVSHHGPENQFYVLPKPEDGSPYVDYPITAFYHEEGVPKILAIPRGPKGFRDVYLKRFMAKKRRQGYNLYGNIHAPGWQWSYHRKYNYEQGWSDRDALGLKASPEEIPFPGNCNCNQLVDKYGDKNQVVTPIRPEGKEIELFTEPIFPNPSSDVINFRILSQNELSLKYHILTLDGKPEKSGTLQVLRGKNRFQINISNLIPGYHILVLNSPGKILAKKFQILR